MSDPERRPVVVEVWSDVVCPWCYIGKRRLEAALAGFEGRDAVEVVWRPFELDPRGPAVRPERYVERLASKYGTDLEGAQAMIDRMVRSAAGEGIEMRFDLARPGNTFDAHRLLHLARDHGLQAALAERLFAATFTEGRPVGDQPTLVELAAAVGLDAGEAARVLDGDELRAEVRAEEQTALRLGATGVPFFVFNRRYAVAGARRPDVLLEALSAAAEPE